MESQPQNPEFRINPENFRPCVQSCQDVFMSSRGEIVLTNEYRVDKHEYEHVLCIRRHYVALCGTLLCNRMLQTSAS